MQTLNNLIDSEIIIEYRGEETGTGVSIVTHTDSSNFKLVESYCENKLIDLEKPKYLFIDHSEIETTKKEGTTVCIISYTDSSNFKLVENYCENELIDPENYNEIDTTKEAYTTVRIVRYTDSFNFTLVESHFHNKGLDPKKPVCLFVNYRETDKGAIERTVSYKMS